MGRNFFKGISKNVILLSGVSFLNDLSSEMIMPILPMFIKALGGTGIIVGLIAGIRDSISSILKVISGYWSDKLGRRKIFVFLGYFSSAIFKFLLSFSKSWQQVLVFGGLERIGKGMRTAPRDALIAESMPERKGKAFGIHRALDTSGAVSGSILVFFLCWILALSFSKIIFIASGIAFLSLIPLFWIREKRKPPQEENFFISLKTLPQALKLFITIASIFTLANFSYMFFVLKVQNIFSGRARVIIPVLLYILFNVFYAIFAIPFGSLSDRIGRRKVIISGYCLFSVITLGFALFNNIGVFIILFILYGLFYAIVDGNQRAYISDLSPEELKSTALGTFHTLIGLVSLPGNIIAGFLWQSISPTATFIYGSIISIISVGMFIAFRKNLS